MSSTRVYDPPTVGVDLVVKQVVEELDAFQKASIRSMEKDEPESEYALSNFLASMFATIFEDTIIQIRILTQCNNELSACKLYLDMPVLLAIKFNVKQLETIDDLGDGTDYDTAKRKMDKLSNDRKYFTQVGLDVYKELTIKKSYESLARHVTAIIDLNRYRANLVEEEAKNRQWYKDLRKQLRQLRRHVTSVTYEMNANIEKLKTESEDCVWVDEVNTRYVEGWQRARTEQHIQTIYNDQLHSIASIEYYKQREEHEQRVHSEVEIFTNIMINETLGKIEYWMDKYETDAEKLDLKIQLQKNAWQDMLDERFNLEAMIAKHEEMISEWIAFKDERERIRAYRALMTKSAIMVQAWWRGLLVRRCLGPYAIKKGRKKKTV